MTHLPISQPIPALRQPEYGMLDKLRQRGVTLLKNAATRLLHQSSAGELLLLRMYFMGEIASVDGISHEVSPWPMPVWLQEQNRQHVQDEGQHIRLISEAIRRHGGQVPHKADLDLISRHKVKRWKQLALNAAPQFSVGRLVPAYVIGLCAEQMALRVLNRHCQLIGPSHDFYPLLDRIRQDEIQHVEYCARALESLVSDEEIPALLTLLQQIRRIDQSWGLTTMAGLLLVGIGFSIRRLFSPPASSHANRP